MKSVPTHKVTMHGNEWSNQFEGSEAECEQWIKDNSFPSYAFYTLPIQPSYFSELHDAATALNNEQ